MATTPVVFRLDEIGRNCCFRSQRMNSSNCFAENYFFFGVSIGEMHPCVKKKDEKKDEKKYDFLDLFSL